ncbi:MAG: UDP-N-acetylmuramoyl-tripeptide--D-alanyl-D-alanine ligase [Betaproteobacteria bacterium]
MSALMTVSELGRAVAALDVRGDGRIGFSSVSTDTRTLAPGALYVALRGERFDGHDFVVAARERGAAAALVERIVDADLPQVVVADARRALGLGAAQWRARFSLPVIAVAGSNGKTTVTQMIASILAAAHGDRGRLATRGNLNNEVGVPLMLWQLARHHRAAVFELGMNHPGEIAWLAGLVRPTVALVNNAQREHQEFMQSVEATAYENGEVIAALPLSDDGVAVFPADDACRSIWRQLAGTRRVVDFAIEADAVVTATYTLRAEGARVSMATPLGLVEVELAVTGLHNVRNALAAAACAIAAGTDAGAIADGLRAFRPVAGRGVRHRTGEGALLIDDTYNANPDSVRAAIDLLAGFEGERVLVLGDMGEVGARGPEFHREVGAHARERGIDALVALGPMASDAAGAFGTGAVHCGDIDSVVGAVRPRLGPSVTVLVKGSRFMRMERVVQALAASQPEGVH